MIRTANALIASHDPAAVAALVGTYAVEPGGVFGGVWNDDHRRGAPPRVLEVRHGRLLLEDQRHPFSLDYFADGLFCDTLGEVREIAAMREGHGKAISRIESEASAKKAKEKARHRVALAERLHGRSITWASPEVTAEVKLRLELGAPLPGDALVLAEGEWEGTPMFEGEEAAQHARLTALTAKNAVLIVASTHAAPDEANDNVTLELVGVEGHWSSSLFRGVDMRSRRF